MRDRDPGNPVPAAQVRTMFDRIAPIYDAMNRVMTAGLDDRWRRSAVRATALRAGGSVVDVACGSGALTRPLARAVGSRGAVVGIDVSGPMLRVAARRPPVAGSAPIRYREGDALALPEADDAFDAATIAFGLRNVADYRSCLAEMARVTRPGGRLVVLELAAPTRGMARFAAATWFDRMLPIVGRLAGGGSAYQYLPSSVRAYPRPADIAELMREVGLQDVAWRPLALGMVTLHVATVS